MRFEIATHVNATPETVFDYLADIQRHPEWSGAVEFGLQEMQVVTPGPVRVGTRFRSVGRNATGTDNRDVSEIIVLDPPSRIGWDTSFELNGARAIFSHRYLLTAEGSGTKLTYAIERATPLNLKGRLLLLFLAYFKRKEAEGVVCSGLASFRGAA